MSEVVKWYELQKDDDTYLYLGSSAGKEKFYEKFGFNVCSDEFMEEGILHVEMEKQVIKFG